jgi:hypothetical protein
MTLHSAAGPSLSAADADTFKGDILTSNCDVKASGQATNAGCGIVDTSNLTFGTGFNQNQGGLYATEWTDQFIKIWFFPRGTFPDDVAAGNPQPNDKWGTPRAVFQGNFNMDDRFKNQQLVFDTTFCKLLIVDFRLITNVLKVAIGQATPGVLRLHAPLSLRPAMSMSPTTLKPLRKHTGPSILYKSSKIAVFRTPICALVTRLRPKRLLQVKVLPVKLPARLLSLVLLTPLANAMKLELEPTRLSWLMSAPDYRNDEEAAVSYPTKLMSYDTICNKYIMY